MERLRTSLKHKANEIRYRIAPVRTGSLNELMSIAQREDIKVVRATLVSFVDSKYKSATFSMEMRGGIGFRYGTEITVYTRDHKRISFFEPHIFMPNYEYLDPQKIEDQKKKHKTTADARLSLLQIRLGAIPKEVYDTEGKLVSAQELQNLSDLRIPPYTGKTVLIKFSD